MSHLETTLHLLKFAKRYGLSNDFSSESTELADTPTVHAAVKGDPLSKVVAAVKQVTNPLHICCILLASIKDGNFEDNLKTLMKLPNQKKVIKECLDSVKMENGLVTRFSMNLTDKPMNSAYKSSAFTNVQAWVTVCFCIIEFYFSITFATKNSMSRRIERFFYQIVLAILRTHSCYISYKQILERENGFIIMEGTSKKADLQGFLMFNSANLLLTLICLMIGPKTPEVPTAIIEEVVEENQKALQPRSKLPKPQRRSASPAKKTKPQNPATLGGRGRSPARTPYGSSNTEFNESAVMGFFSQFFTTLKDFSEAIELFRSGTEFGTESLDPNSPPNPPQNSPSPWPPPVPSSPVLFSDLRMPSVQEFMEIVLPPMITASQIFNAILFLLLAQLCTYMYSTGKRESDQVPALEDSSDQRAVPALEDSSNQRAVPEGLSPEERTPAPSTAVILTGEPEMSGLTVQTVTASRHQEAELEANLNELISEANQYLATMMKDEAETAIQFTEDFANQVTNIPKEVTFSLQREGVRDSIVQYAQTVLSDENFTSNLQANNLRQWPKRVKHLFKAFLLYHKDPTNTTKAAKMFLLIKGENVMELVESI